MSDLQIVIPTYRRMPRQSTLGYLPASWTSRTVLVLDQHDYELRNLYDLRGAELLVHPPEIDTIAKKRKWIIEQDRFQKIVMLDDDLRFAVRHPNTGTKLHQATSDELEVKLTWLESDLDDYAHAGWSARQGNNNCEVDFVENARMMFVLGYHCGIIRSFVRSGKIELGRVRTREDMELCVQLLRLGYKNHVDFTIAADQVSGFGAKGGCSDERTIKSTSEDAQIFADLHPGIVKTVDKVYKGSPARKEVVVYWKKAYASSGKKVEDDESQAE